MKERLSYFAYAVALAVLVYQGFLILHLEAQLIRKDRIIQRGCK